MVEVGAPRSTRVPDRSYRWGAVDSKRLTGCRHHPHLRGRQLGGNDGGSGGGDGLGGNLGVRGGAGAVAPAVGAGVRRRDARSRETWVALCVEIQLEEERQKSLALSIGITMSHLISNQSLDASENSA